MKVKSDSAIKKNKPITRNPNFVCLREHLCCVARLIGTWWIVEDNPTVLSCILFAAAIRRKRELAPLSRSLILSCGYSLMYTPRLVEFVSFPSRLFRFDFFHAAISKRSIPHRKRGAPSDIRTFWYECNLVSILTRLASPSPPSSHQENAFRALERTWST